VRRSLAVLVAATTSLVLVAFVVPLAVLIRSATAEQAVSAATRDAGALVSVVATSDRATAELAAEQSSGMSGHPFTIYYPDGAVVGDQISPRPAVELALRGRRLTAEAAGGVEVVMAVELVEGGTGAVRTFVPDDELSAGVLRSWLVLGALGIGLVALGVVVADRLARNLVRPLVRAAEVSHRLGAGELDARAEVACPAETRAVASGLNQLAGRIAAMLRQERESLADLSHRLRTPLMALRLEAEELPTDQSRRILDGVGAVERAVTQVINDARARGVEAAGGGRCDAAAVVRERVAFWSPLAEDTGREFHTAVTAGPVSVRCAAPELAAAVDALLGNVFAHTPDGAPFAVSLEERPNGGASLTVAEGGAGLGTADPVGRGVSSGSSTGLGRVIARRVAESSGGGLTVGRSELGGAAIMLELGPADSADAGG